MKRIKILKKVGLIMSIGVILSLTNAVGVNAAVLQANPTTNTTLTTKGGATWLTSIRQMEATGQAMGLTETINSTSQLGTTESNGIDVHMMKSTEYGAMAILSASGFGNPANTTTIDTTTGNKTGVYMQSTKIEWIAGLRSGVGGISTSLAHRYFNRYAATSAKPGDALDLKWHSPVAVDWGNFDFSLLRGGNYGVFGLTCGNFDLTGGCGRAVVVSGNGF